MSVGSVHRDRKNWRYAFTFAGNRVQQGGFSTRKAAVKAMETKKEEMLAVGGEIKKTTFPAAYREYLEDMKDENAPNWRRNKVTYGKYFESHFGDVPVYAVHEFDVNRYKHARKKEGGVSTGTIDKELATLKHFFKWAAARRFCGANPAAGVKKFGDDNRRGVALSRMEAKRLLALADPDLKLRILLALAYGLRAGEIAAIRHEDVDRQKGQLRVMREKKRRNEPTVISAPPELLSLTGGLGRGAGKRRGFLFPAEKCYKRWRRLLMKAGLSPDVRFHDLRHTAASWQLEDGQNIEAIRKFLGHESVATTARYLHVDDAQVDGMGAKTLAGLL